MKNIRITGLIFIMLLWAVISIAADQRIQYTEEMVGAGHPTKPDTLNRLSLVEHNTDGTHRTDLSLTTPIIPSFYQDAGKTHLLTAPAGTGNIMLNVVEDTTPQLGGNLDSNGKVILLTAAPADHVAEGIARTGTAGENLAQGDVVYCKLNGGAWKWYKYDVNGTDKLIMPSGIATVAITSGNAGAILTAGQFRDDTWALSPSADAVVTVYASATPGGVTLTAPSTSGDEVVMVGVLVAANTIQLKFGYAWVEVN